MQPVDADVLLAGALLRLDQPRRPLHAHDEATSHLRVERARVAGLVDAQDALDPVDRALVKLGGFWKGFGSYFVKFVQNAEVDTVKFDKIQCIFEFKSNKLDL